MLRLHNIWHIVSAQLVLAGIAIIIIVATERNFNFIVILL